jgi:argininosuccinate lyase
VKFAPEYVSCVLNENFEDAKAQFLSPLMAIHYAHLVMLEETRIVAGSDARAIRAALEAIDLDEVRRAHYDGTCEDLFFYVEGLVATLCGEETAGRLHTARSRNDIDMTMYRMQQRELVLALFGATGLLRRVLLDLAARHREDVFPAHTHTQPAQPSTVAHYLMAVVEQLERDAVRLRAAYGTTNANPLGSCAITGTGFPIDRQRTTALLGFDRPTGNTYGSIATVDYLLESVSATAVLLTGLGRVIQDLLLWCTREFGYLRLADGFVQCSSIMPQKRNPVALEHARAISSKAVGQGAAILLAAHNTPFGDIVDTEDDLQPLVFAMFRDAARAVRLTAAALAAAQFDTARMAERATEGWITITELADTLTREHGVPFTAAHAIASRMVRRGENGIALSAMMREASQAVLGRPIDMGEAVLEQLLSPRHFVDVRTTPGGPAPGETARAIAASEAILAEDQGWFAGTVGRLRAAEEALKQAVAQL